MLDIKARHRPVRARVGTERLERKEIPQQQQDAQSPRCPIQRPFMNESDLT